MTGISVPLIFVVLVTLALLAAVAFVAMILLPPYLAWRLGRRLEAATQQRDSRGETIQRTPTGRMGLGNLGLDMNFVAGIGKNAAPQQTLNEITMHPTIGLRFISVAVSCLVTFLIVTDFEDMFGGNIYLAGGMFALMIYAGIQTNLYELRYDRDGFIARDWFFRQQHVMWKDVLTLQDNGHYLYVFTLQDGTKVEVQKFLVGMPDFLTYAKGQIHFHDRH